MGDATHALRTNGLALASYSCRRECTSVAMWRPVFVFSVASFVRRPDGRSRHEDHEHEDREQHEMHEARQDVGPPAAERDEADAEG